MFAEPLTRPILSFPAKLARFNWPFLAVITLLVAIGVATLYSAEGAWHPWAKQHATRFCFGLGLLFLVALVDMRTWFRFAYPLYAVSLALLIVVAVIGTTVNGAKSWLSFGPINFQPSEAMKIALVLALAHYYQTLSAEKVSRPLALVIPMLMVLVPVALVLSEPDLGTAAIVAAVGAGVIFFAGVSWVYFVSAIIGAWAVLPFVWNSLRDYQKERLLTFVDPSRDPSGSGYHITQSKIALGAGGYEGQGFMQGMQAKLDFLPEKHTDFIFTMFAEEHGFVGAMALLSLFVILLMFISFMALRCKSRFGKLLAAGAGVGLFVYVFINVAMVIGLVPVVGVPLPLVSFGGSAMITVMISMGLVLNAQIHRRETFADRAPRPH